MKRPENSSRGFAVKLLRAIDAALGRAASTIRIARFKALYSGLEVGTGVTFGPGVYVRVLNGATLAIGDRTAIQAHCRIESDGRLSIGPDSFVGAGSIIVAVDAVDIGSDALIASHVVIRDANHGTSGTPYRRQPLQACAVSIGRNVWLGANAVVLAGVTIGDDAVIGAGAVVTRSVASGAVAAGVPARALRP